MEILRALLFIIGIPVFTAMFIVGVCYTTIKHIIKWDYSLKKQFMPILKSVALIFDGLANAGCGELLNDLLIKKAGDDFHPKAYKYGKWHDTISEVTGINYMRKVLKKIGIWFKNLLDILLFEKDHAVKAIMENKYYTTYAKEKAEKDLV